MLYRHKNFEETLVHQCADADKYTTAFKQEMANVRVHDVSAYLSVPIRNYKAEKVKGKYPVIGYESVRIERCPYCGVVLESDERTGEYLNLKLL